MAEIKNNSQPVESSEIERRLEALREEGGRTDHLTLPHPMNGNLPSDEINQRAQELRNVQLNPFVDEDDSAPSGLGDLTIAEARSQYHTGVNPRDPQTPEASQVERPVTTQIVLTNDVSQLPKGVSGRIISRGVMEVQVPVTTVDSTVQADALKEAARRQVVADAQAVRDNPANQEARVEETALPITTPEEIRQVVEDEGE